jgi:TPR repeat protein
MNDGRANAILGQLYAEGKGVSRDYYLAHKYYTESLNMGYDPAMALLADLAGKEGKMAERDYWIVQLTHSERSSIQPAAKTD